MGRADDMVVVRGVNLYPSAVEAVVRALPEIAEYRVEVSRRACAGGGGLANRERGCGGRGESGGCADGGVFAPHSGDPCRARDAAAF